MLEFVSPVLLGVWTPRWSFGGSNAYILYLRLMRVFLSLTPVDLLSPFPYPVVDDPLLVEIHLVTVCVLLSLNIVRRSEIP
jgi:hypothetical protein